MKPPIIRDKKFQWYKDKRILTLTLGIFIIGTMILSIFGYSRGSGASLGNVNSYNYNGYKFIETEQGWLTYINNNQVVFYFGPRDLENFQASVDLRANNLNYLEKIYLSFNPNENLQLAVQEFTKFIKFNSNFVIACSEDVTGCENLPLKTCKDSNDNIGVIQFELSEKTEISTKDTCINIKGTQTSIIMLVDKIALTNFGIMK